MTKPYDLLDLLAKFARQSGMALTDPLLVPLFLEDARSGLDAALKDAPLVHGARTERQFEALVLTLGQFRLLKAEDQGRLHAEVHCRAPDYRVVLQDGRQWLIEVKNVHVEDPLRQEAHLTAPYLASLRAYSELVGVPLKIAHYWSKWQFWSLVDPDLFITSAGGAHIEMGAAMAASELAQLGDLWFCTVAPIRLVVEVDQGSVAEVIGEEPSGGHLAAVRLFSGDAELIDDRDKQLAWILMLYGEWELSGPRALLEGDKLLGVEFSAAPVEDDDVAEPRMMGPLIGQASRIFARYFSQQTTVGDAVIQLHGQPTPEWFTPIANWDFKHSNLPLWVLQVQSQTPGTAQE